MASNSLINITGDSPAKPSVLVSNEALHIFFIASTCALFPTCVLGVITNCLNIISYAAIGFQDSATSCFFALSVSDLFSIVIFLVITVSSVIKINLPDLPINTFDLVYILSSDLSMVNNISVVLKTYIAIQQGCCVAFPFHVKHLFTQRRTVAIILCVYTLCVACYLPSLCHQSMRAVTDPSTNKTEITLYFKSGWVIANSFMVIFNGTVLICTCQVLILISLIVIVSGLSASSRYKHHALVGDYRKMDSPNGRRLLLPGPVITQPNVSLNSEQHLGQHTEVDRGDRDLQLVERKSHWTSKELRVLKQVTLVSGIFSACNFPALVISLATRVVSEVEYRGIFNNLIWILFTCSYFAGLMNSSTNFFIYCNFNSKFIETVRKLVRPRIRQ